ncbi:pSer/pThr/pTyr-binding forkhead associated (FHA) protein [Conyzicola lurida]|uniref:PSer/pThr/pTyr-binding forkhead associated (FHA) protein n=1 Tax=Conyzicola lurida TaxID=1172621 RepID=A0A841AT06_9MICO|nr:FHA domain-containing protein [Conyzicola lurida]MBB5844931.1 pSer/pThr/pTyr-binding forkhead associated (FHA) protein [Conyzicola lurida]
MTSELTLFVLKVAFLGLMWAFVFAVVYALRTDLFGQKVRKLPASVDAAAPVIATAAPVVAATPAPTRSPNASAASSSGASRLVITGGAKEGLEIALPSEQLTIGRSSDSGLVIRDDYTSTHHARLLNWNEGWVIQDLDSTNGTYLDGTRVIVPTQVPLNTPVKIGTTSFELRR